MHYNHTFYDAKHMLGYYIGKLTKISNYKTRKFFMMLQY